MSLNALIEYDAAPPEVRAIYDDIRATRQTEFINNIWKVLANHPPTLAMVWGQVKNVMGPGALDALTKQLIYIAVSATNGCEYCLHSHTAAALALGMTPAMFAETLAVAGLANETNRLATAWRVPVDEAFRVELEPAEGRTSG
jgi:AhpD family alkylhydroperoxidase